MEDDHWIPERDDGSGWAPVDWGSVIRGTRYFYRHAEAREAAAEKLPLFYRVVTRLESNELAPHENEYFVPRVNLAEFLAELSLGRGAEMIWHVEPCNDVPPESGFARSTGVTNAGD